MFEKIKARLAQSWGFEEASVKRDPKKIGLKKVGSAIRSSGGSYEFSTVDLVEVSRAYYTDSYIRRAVDKYSELIFKAGWDITGKNDAAVQYVWLRLKFMAEATGVPLDEFLKTIASDLALFGNSFVVKQRQGNLPQGVKAQGYTSNKPVLGYFALPPTTMQISRDPSGQILLYQQNPALGGGAGGGQQIQLKPEDVIHFYYKKPTGRGFGIPFVWNVMDDVKMLRQIEENVARLIYRNLFPLYQYQVGLDKPGYEATDEEIEYIREQIRDMPLDGGIVVPERHNITVVSNSQAAMDASPYIQYFRERVFTGLMVSDITMGMGSSGGGATADNLAAEMIDGVKEFQSVYKMIFNSKIVNELLFEGGFDPIMNPDDEVDFVFAEIELDAKIKKENHAVQLFTQNAITHEEMRQEMGLDPVADETRLYFNMVTIPVAEQALQAKAAAAGTTAANNAGSNKNRPANQNGKKMSPGKPKRSQHHSVEDENNSLEESDELFSTNLLTEGVVKVNLLSELGISNRTEEMTKSWNHLRDDVVSMIQHGRSFDHIRAFALKLSETTILTRMKSYLSETYVKGTRSAQQEIGSFTNVTSSSTEINRLVKRSDAYIERLMKDMHGLLEKATWQSDPKQSVIQANAAFDSNRYRLEALIANEMMKSYNYGRATAAKVNQITEAKFAGEADCPLCEAKLKENIDLTRADLLESIPPFHPNCSCILHFNKASGGGAG
jgi:hypothetical protein